MTKSLLFAASILFLLTGCTDVRKSPHETVSSENIKVTYGRPYKKGREIFGGLEKYGHVWRTGADEATEITFRKDGIFGGQPVKEGSYSLYTIPNQNEWTIILNKQTGQSGKTYDKNQDLLRVQVPARKLDQPIEQLTIRFEEKNMIIEWDRTQVAVPLEF